MQARNGTVRCLVGHRFDPVVFAIISLLVLSGIGQSSVHAQRIIGETVTDSEIMGTPPVEEAWDPQLYPGNDSASTGRNRALELVRRNDASSVRRYKQSFFQRLSFLAETIDPSVDSGLGRTQLKTAATVAVPLGSFENLLLITPNFDVDLIDSDPWVDVPDALYNAGVNFMFRKQLNDRWGTLLAVSPGYASDFENSEDALRIRGFGFANWQWVPEHLTLLLGVVYLDRNDLPLLPAVGLVWAPTPDWQFDLTFPRPKLAHRLKFVPAECEEWIFLSGQIGGRTWSVERANGLADELTLRDYRVTFGWEKIVDGGGGFSVEIGWAFGRELEYEIQPLELPFDDAVLVRAGITF